MEKLTVKELKQELRDRHLPVSGNKTVLINRLRAHTRPSQAPPQALTGYKDADLQILRALPYKDIISICSVDKYARSLCGNEHLWRQLIIRDYGVDLKGYVDSYKKAYRNLYNYKRGENEKLAWAAAAYGYLPLLDKLIDDEYVTIPRAFEIVTGAGNEDTLDYMFNNYEFTNNLDRLLLYAVRNDNVATLEYLIGRGADADQEQLLLDAISFNNINVLRVLLDRSAPPTVAFVAAIRSGNIVTFDLLVEALLDYLENSYDLEWDNVADRPLMLTEAIVVNNEKMINAVLETLNYGSTPAANPVQFYHLSLAIKRGVVPRIFDKLIKLVNDRKYDTVLTRDQVISLLREAAKKRNIDIFVILRDYFKDVFNEIPTSFLTKPQQKWAKKVV